tara:strand:- start:140 stop:445 length:306 start_codon:yes stop_codon:yes gene_type:complete
MNKKAELKNKLIEQVTPERVGLADYECEVHETTDSYELYTLKRSYEETDIYQNVYYYKENMMPMIEDILRCGESIYFWSGDLMEELYIFDLIDEIVSEVEA